MLITSSTWTVLECMQHSFISLVIVLLDISIDLTQHILHGAWWVESRSHEVSILHGWVLVRLSSLSQWLIQDVVDILSLHFPTSPRWSRSLLILLQSHVIVFNSLCKVASLILTSSSRISSIDVVGIDAQDCGEVINALVYLTKLLKGATSDVVSSCIGWV